MASNAMAWASALDAGRPIVDCMNHPPNPSSELESTKALASRLQVRPETILKWASRGRIPCIRLSARVLRFDHAAVLRALANQTAKGVTNG